MLHWNVLAFRNHGCVSQSKRAGADVEDQLSLRLYRNQSGSHYCLQCQSQEMAQVLSTCSGPLADKPDLERWYIGLSILLGFGVILVPTILGHFGKNTSRGNSNNSFWYVLSCVLLSS